MSVSTDALLFYGWTYEEEDEASEALEQIADGNEAESFGVKVERHGWLAGPFFIAAIVERASRGYPMNITTVLTADVSVMQDRLKKFCEHVKIPYQEPAWIMASDTDYF